MSYVSLYKPVNDRITKTSTENSNEVIGLLIGNLVNDTLVIEDSITGEFSGEPHRVVLHPSTVAKIADDLVKGRLRGNIVGWYHSHTEDGIFFSQTDVDTQKKLQQFSQLMVGMVVDARNGEIGFFRLDSSGKPVRISDDKVRVFSKRSEAAPVKHPPTPLPMGKPRPRLEGPMLIKLILGVVLIALVISLSILAIETLSTKPLPVRPMIYHNPVANALVGSSISIIANSTGIKNMTLFYAKEGESFKSVEMTAEAPNQFQSTIPASEVTGNLSYYLEGTTDAGDKISSDVFHILVADFNLSPENQTVTVYRNATVPSSILLNLISINGFSQNVKLSATGVPNGVTLLLPEVDRPGAMINIGLAATSNASLGSFPVYVTAYSGEGSQVVERTARLMVRVTDFDLTVYPTSISVLAGSQSEFAITVTGREGFDAPVTVMVTDVPQGAKIVLLSTNGSTLLSLPGTISLAIQATGVRQGTYTITVTVKASLPEGGYVIHSQRIQVTVR